MTTIQWQAMMEFSADVQTVKDFSSFALEMYKLLLYYYLLILLYLLCQDYEIGWLLIVELIKIVIHVKLETFSKLAWANLKERADHHI